jgi:Sap, sulfolipid-1-addressing protein
MDQLIGTVLVLGLAVAVTSPMSVVTVIVLLSLPSGRPRALAFVAGWTIAICAIALVVVFVFHGQDFSSKKTTPSQAASAAELAIGFLLVVGGAVKYRRRGRGQRTASPPKWLERLGRTHWPVGLLVGAVMLTYSLTVVAALEILKANVSVADDALAFAIFALASIVTIAAPIAFVLAAPERSEQTLARWKEWLLENAGTAASVVIMVIGAALIAKGAYDLTAVTTVGLARRRPAAGRRLRSTMPPSDGRREPATLVQPSPPLMSTFRGVFPPLIS